MALPAIEKRFLSKEHPSYAASLNNLAELLKTQGSTIMRPLYWQSLAIERKVSALMSVLVSQNFLSGLWRRTPRGCHGSQQPGGVVAHPGQARREVYLWQAGIGYRYSRTQ
jgi:hypothetical protein